LERANPLACRATIAESEEVTFGKNEEKGGKSRRKKRQKPDFETPLWLEEEAEAF